MAEFEASFAKLKNTDGPGAADLAHDVPEPATVSGMFFDFTMFCVVLNDFCVNMR